MIRAGRHEHARTPQRTVAASPEATQASDGGAPLAAHHDAWRVTRLEAVLGWARSQSLAPLALVSACCGAELAALSSPRFDMGRHGVGPPSFAPQQADLLLVLGTITVRQAQLVRRIHARMADPKWVVAVGGCACTGGPYDNYATVQGVDQIVDVDIYIPGCPPRPEAVLDGLLKLQARIRVGRGARRPTRAS